MSFHPPRVLPVGGAALTVELGDGIDPVANGRVRALDESLAADPPRGIREAVPTYRSLLVVYDPREASFEDLRAAIVDRLAAPPPPHPRPRALSVPTVYGGDDGPDLGEVATRLGLSEAEVVARHAGREYTAFMLGFRPGFAYLGVLPSELELPRRSTPRVRVPAGSVGIAGAQTGIYPVVSPGGWNLIGRTALRLFDPSADSPSWIVPGDRVRFVAVPELPASPSAPPPPDRSPGTPAIEVLEGGLLTTVQDAGRFGHRRIGVGWSGPADAEALAEANRRLGNPTGAAALECTVAGPSLRFLATVQFTVTGGDLGAVLHRTDLGAWPVPRGRPVRARAGNLLTFAGRRSGCRAYVGLEGGIDLPRVLGSVATDLAAGFGGLDGRPLRPGDTLSIGALPRSGATGAEAAPRDGGGARVRVVLGPQADAFAEDAVARLLSEEWIVGADSDRTGCRLDGPRLTHLGPGEIVSDGMVPGCIQVPPDGRPIVMLADCPTTGGYPKVACVVPADLPRLAQALPGQGAVRFEAVSPAEAERLTALACAALTAPSRPPR